MKVYELTATGYETEDVPQIVFDESNVIGCQMCENGIKIFYDVSQDFLFPTFNSWISVLIQDIHNQILGGVLSVNVPIGEYFDTIIYIVRFDEKEFEIIKKILLDKFPEVNYNIKAKG